MEKPPFTFKDITHFSVKDVENKDTRFDYITKLTLEIWSELPKGKYSLKLIKPFPPLLRGGEKLIKLKSLDHKDIESISASRYSNGEKNECIKIHGKKPDKTIFIKCNRIQGVPRFGENIN